MDGKRFSRRDFLKTTGALTAMTALGEIPADLLAATYERKLVRYPEKTDLIILTARPPQLETPLSYFKELLTPNEALFVRWHITPIPTTVDLAEWRLKIGGNVEREVSLSLNELKTKFEKVSITAVCQCSGNGRGLSDPQVPGGQWAHGAMGNTTWGGARVKDVLSAAGVKPGSVDVTFDGLDKGTLPSVPDFIKSLPVEKALDPDMLIAYEMNGRPLTMLNGFLLAARRPPDTDGGGHRLGLLHRLTEHQGRSPGSLHAQQAWQAKTLSHPDQRHGDRGGRLGRRRHRQRRAHRDARERRPGGRRRARPHHR